MTIHPPIPGNDPGNYCVPSPSVPTICMNGHYYHAAYAAEPDAPKADRPPGQAHANGTCGYMASLCSACWEIELAWHKRIAEAIARQSPPTDAERRDYGAYWRRVRGRMLDTWPEAALHAIQSAFRIPHSAIL